MQWSIIREFLEPVIIAAQVASSFFDTGLLMVVKEHYNVSNSSTSLFAAHYKNPDDDQQRAVTNFYMIYNIITGFTPFLPALFLSGLGDKWSQKIPICVSLLGYVISRALSLLIVLLELPIEVMFGAAVVYNLCGGFSAYWGGLMALAAAQSTEAKRSVYFGRIEMAYGISGLFGSMASGHLFQNLAFAQKKGALLFELSVSLYLFSFIYSFFVLKVPSVERRQSPLTAEQTSINHSLPSRHGEESSCETEVTEVVNQNSFDKINIGLLFTAGILYDMCSWGITDILNSFVLKEPLNWDATQVGYGNAAYSAVFITSFLGVLLFSRCLSDTTIIIIGMVSFAAGILVMAFVTKTFLFYVARALNLFALIPMPTIRSLLSKQVPGSSYGKIMIVLQLSFTLAGVAYSPIFTKIYQATLDWFAGFVFTLSSILTCLAIIPICIVGWRTTRQEGYERIPS
ncbi:solute carrier family 46 member 2 isoform X1 [Lepisosteus oculatus]|uniref:solute carrier family 46 member 2 isoform X1 n=1 Tax=Lepisosteus oculatus TaxID=7918 RepID=UPI0003EAAB1F|nr:PREDICTED: thymic stromal cotransporter homolog isoform X1 [Lepisosteus oculatus]